MSYIPFIVQRQSFFSMVQLECIQEAMLRILEDVGIAVLDKDVLEKLARRKFTIRENRVFIDRKLVLKFLETERQNNSNLFSETPQQIRNSNTEIRLTMSNYPQHVHDIETDTIVPFTTERLIEATKLVDQLSNRGIVSSLPGIPADVAPQLQPVVQYWIAATYSRHGRRPVDAKSAMSLPYVMAMAEILGYPMRSLTAWVFSPLTLGGESLNCVLKFQDKLTSVGVGSMPSAGVTAPINVGDAFALASAEVLGSAILLKEIVAKDIHWHIELFPIDLHSMAMVFGSPENYLFQLMSSEVDAYFHGTKWYPAAGNIHTNAKLPGSQACAEKSSLMTAGALLGARRFGSVGTLSLDEVFSAEQLLYDLEIKDHVQRIVKGIEGECEPKRCLKDVLEGIKQQNFVGLDTTLDSYRALYWQPRLFERQFLAAWKGEGSQTIRQRTHAMIRKLLSQHEYELERKLQKELDGILERAKEKLDADSTL